MSRYPWPENLRRNPTVASCRGRVNGCVCDNCMLAMEKPHHMHSQTPVPPTPVQAPKQNGGMMYDSYYPLASHGILVFIFYLVVAYLLFSIGLFVGQFKMMKKYMMKGLNKSIQQPV